jgi:hypothetical protein
VTKLENRLRKMHDRRRVHYGRRSPASVAEATGAIGALASPMEDGAPQAAATAVLEMAPAYDPGMAQVPAQRWDEAAVDETLPGQIVREKEHPAKPMTVDQALYEMELVGHDFYLFHDADKQCASVVYRRKGFDYGVIRLG